jgi:flagellar biosynthetic protein FliP
MTLKRLIKILSSLLVFLPAIVHAADITLPGISIDYGAGQQSDETATAFKLLLTLTLLSLAPAFLVIMTSFTRIIIVLSMLRHALGMQQTPPNTVLVSLAMLLTMFSMAPVFNEMNKTAIQPYLDGKLDTKKAVDEGIKPLRLFMLRQTREQDMAVILEINDETAPQSAEDISTLHIISAFLLSELKTAFQIGFIIFLPFLLVDLVVASVLMSMGMIMVPPMMISLPLKVLMFVLIDGWALIVQSLMASFS